MKNEIRFWSMAVLLLMAAFSIHYIGYSGSRDHIPDRLPLSRFPDSAGKWIRIDTRRLGTDQAIELGADDYLSRTYTDQIGSVAYFFVAYYESQRHRQTIHSPQNCIPGAGWSMANHRVHSLNSGKVNEYLIEKDGVKMLAFYWYQGRGRVVAGDYLSRLLVIRDALINGRSDGALVRIIVPLSAGTDAEATARAAGLEFIRAIIPSLSVSIPD